MHTSPVPDEGFDLLRVPALRALILWWGFPYVFQALILAVFLALAVVSWGVLTPEGVNAKLFSVAYALLLASPRFHNPDRDPLIYTVVPVAALVVTVASCLPCGTNRPRRPGHCPPT